MTEAVAEVTAAVTARRRRFVRGTEATLHHFRDASPTGSRGGPGRALRGPGGPGRVPGGPFPRRSKDEHRSAAATRCQRTMADCAATHSPLNGTGRR